MVGDSLLFIHVPMIKRPSFAIGLGSDVTAQLRTDHCLSDVSDSSCLLCREKSSNHWNIELFLRILRTTGHVSLVILAFLCVVIVRE